jgi:hypothetical protein
MLVAKAKPIRGRNVSIIVKQARNLRYFWIISNTIVTWAEMPTSPAATGTLATLAGTEALSSKTITSSTLDSSAVGATTPSTGKFTTLTRKAGGGTGYGTAMIDLYATSTPVGNITSGTDDLMSYTLPASTMGADGDHVDIEWSVRFGANANNKTFKVVFGSTTLYTIGASAFSGVTLTGRTRLTWAVAGTQQALTTVTPTSTASPWAAGDGGSYVTATETLTNALTIKGTGLSGSSATDDVKMLWLNVTFGSTP